MSSKFGRRKNLSISASSTIKLQSLEVTSINGVSVKDTEQTNILQTVNIDSNTEDIDMLKNKVQILENYVYELRQIIYQLTNQSI